MLERIRLTVSEMSNYDVCLVAGRQDRPPELHLSLLTDPVVFQPERRAEIDSLFERAAAIRLPMAPPSYAMGLDGTTYELSFESGFNGSTFAWWGGSPPGWEPLAETSDALMSLAREHRRGGAYDFGSP